MLSFFDIVLVIILTIACVFLTRLFMKWSIKYCDSNASMKDKVVIVTGGNGGIGYQTAKNLAQRGGRIILACRSEQRGTDARDKIITETGNKNVVFKQLNLSSLESVRKFAKEIIDTEKRLDVLINNAGIFGLGDRYTDDGIVEGMQINYFAPFLLTLLLLPLLEKSKGRIVNVGSLCHWRGEINFHKINKANSYHANYVYANSKLCLNVITMELARRLKDTEVVVNVLHPGVIATNIMSKNAMFVSRWVFILWCWICCRTAEEGSQTVVYLAVDEGCGKVSGGYYVDCGEAYAHWATHDKALGKELWHFSNNLVDNPVNGLKSN